MQTEPADWPLSARAVVGTIPALKEPLLQDGQLYWLEQRPHEGGRTTLLRRAAGKPQSPTQELTPAPWNLRSRVHEYGGGVFAIGGAHLVFVHDGDRCLWHLDLALLADGPQAPAEGAFRRLTAPPTGAPPPGFADGLIDLGRERWIGVMEQGGRDALVSVPLAGGEPQLLHGCADFGGYGALSPSGRQLAWLEWQQPAMPWERTTLWLAGVGSDGQLQAPRAIAGEQAGSTDESLVQPLWIEAPAGEERLLVASDTSGFWNLQGLDAATGTWTPLLSMAADFGLPQWVYGMRTSAWDGKRLLALCCQAGAWTLGQIEAGVWHPLDLPFDDLAGLSAEAGRVVTVASSPSCGPGLLELELASGGWHHSPASPAPCPLPRERISQPEALWFDGHGGAPTHAWYYPPAAGAHREAPLLVRSHSGPTAMARTGLSLAIQFWTSRGWGVVDVNYGGSTGFGRAYRQRLDGQWGVVDVSDCAAAARAVVAAGKADPARIAIEGGSAGGFTTLAALCFTTVFKVGASRYGVADLTALAGETHRFEAGYLDNLVGPWPEARATYEDRSPLLHADRIRCPVIFFQGMDDKVVPPGQTERMAAALEANGVPVEVHRYPGEGHGFRSSAVQIQVLEATEAFFRRHLALP
ncbi:MAG: prolyl oligopeptidase family serine peptidase [Cyanobacteriota bacterium]|nr:prolyl oligopeptidase family serine peptidase [Cyanobacteriota bacterium]